MDEIENVVEDSRRTRGNDNNEVTCPEENVAEKSTTDELEFEREEEYSTCTGNIPENAHEGFNSPEHAVLATKDHGEVAGIYSHSGMNKNEMFDTEEFDTTSQDVQENQCSNGSSTGNAVNELAKQSSEISENKVTFLFKFASGMLSVGNFTHISCRSVLVCNFFFFLN